MVRPRYVEGWDRWPVFWYLDRIIILMYVDGYMLLVIYLLAVFAAAISVYSLWTLEEIRRHYERQNNTKKSNAYEQYKNKPPVTPTRGKGHWD